jgi:PilZ domain
MLAFIHFLRSPGGAMSDGSDRREARRFTMTLPMRVLAREPNSAELRAHTRDVSYRGLYFLAEAKFEVGSEIDFVITLPQRISQTGEVDIHCRGQIVRVESASDGRTGIAAKIDRYEFQPASTASAA